MVEESPQQASPKKEKKARGRAESRAGIRASARAHIHPLRGTARIRPPPSGGGSALHGHCLPGVPIPTQPVPTSPAPGSLRSPPCRQTKTRPGGPKPLPGPGRLQNTQEGNPASPAGVRGVPLGQRRRGRWPLEPGAP